MSFLFNLAFGIFLAILALILLLIFLAIVFATFIFVEYVIEETQEKQGTAHKILDILSDLL